MYVSRRVGHIGMMLQLTVIERRSTERSLCEGNLWRARPDFLHASMTAKRLVTITITAIGK